MHTMANPEDILRVGTGRPLTTDEAHALAAATLNAPSELYGAASERRNRAFGDVITFSPKVFLPLTNLCRNRCDYCTFRKGPDDPGAHTMSREEVLEVVTRGSVAGCTEALFCLGDTPETAFSRYRARLAELGIGSTVEYLRWAGETALDAGLLPHTNAGILTHDEMAHLRPVNVSMGLMLESTSERLCERGGPHFRAPDKRPAKRIRMTEEAGALRIPFTSGVLVGIGETPAERVDTLLEIRRIHEEFGHIQEVIVQNFRTKPTIPMADHDEPSGDELGHCVALARLILPDDVTVQAPPNLSPADIPTLLAAGVNDLGGISPVTPDFINPGHPWPHLSALADEIRSGGHRLRPRLPIYPSFQTAEWLDPVLIDRVRRWQDRVDSVERAEELADQPPRSLPPLHALA